jgi:hypothetical protein
MNQPIYVPQMQSIVERVNNPAKLVQCIQLFNEEEFAPLVLASIYDEVDRIIVIEGAVGQRAGATPDGHSTDRTVEIVKDFKANRDPGNKILFVQIKKPWASLEEMKQVFLDITSPGDWLIINDADEFYKPEDIRRVRRAIDLYPHATEFVPLFLHFYRWNSHVAVPGPEWQIQHQRIIKNQGGMKYHSHPVATMADGHCSYFSPHMQHRRYMMSNFFIYHYGYARNRMDEIMRDKQAYYEQELAKHGEANRKFDAKVKAWFDNSEPLLSFPDDLHPAIVKKYPSFLENAAITSHPSWREQEVYSASLNNEPIPNIWLCMTQRAAPFMSMYSNMAAV